jgi:hypothetical protein
MPRCGRPASRAVSRPVCADEKNPALSVDRKLFGTSTIGPHPARPALRLLLMIRPARPSLAEVPLADLSFFAAVCRRGGHCRQQKTVSNASLPFTRPTGNRRARSRRLPWSAAWGFSSSLPVHSPRRGDSPGCCRCSWGPRWSVISCSYQRCWWGRWGVISARVPGARRWHPALRSGATSRPKGNRQGSRVPHGPETLAVRLAVLAFPRVARIHDLD